MTELLAPAGSIEALKAAISNGCDAIYLGMKKFGARAYSSNFDIDSLREAIEYAHLRNVKIFVTMNTIIFDEEMEDMITQLHILNDLGVDAVIVQDLAVFRYACDHFQDMEVHCSTQMGIDDLEGTLLCKEMGAHRVVLAREVPIETVKEIRKKAQIPVEIFIHGALCVSYSGNCLMSGLTGYRCGNRGRCVGSCRKEYELIDCTTGKSLGNSFILSTKDLNTINHIDDLKMVDSLKIEGRMKEPTYVANVVSAYRNALDSKITEADKENLEKTFNRTYTDGYLFHTDPKDITNISKPNNFGFEIGKISGTYKDMYEITLNKVLIQNDVIRINHNGQDINLSVAKLYNKKGNLINKAYDICYIKIKENLFIGDKVYKTKDIQFYKELESMLEKEFRRYPLNLKIYAYPGTSLVIDAEGFGNQYIYESEEILDEAKNNPTSRDQVIKQFSRLNDTVFTLGEVEFEDYNAFIPAKLMNYARRVIVKNLYKLKLESKTHNEISPSVKEKIIFPMKNPYITASVTTQEQYDICAKYGLTDIYFHNNTIKRNNNTYEKKKGDLLIGGYGGIYHYRDTNSFITDYSMNITNSISCYEMHRLGAKRVTLSYEINRKQIQELIEAYCKENGGNPSLEMIVYGRAPMLVTKYCPIKKMGLCGKCKTNRYEIKNEMGSFPIICHEDCTTTILNGKVLNLLDEIPYLKGIEAFRLNFTTESVEKTEEIIKVALSKLSGENAQILFNQKTDTRGHYNKDIM